MTETGSTYDRLKREWHRCGGVPLRFFNVAHSGYPDFILCHLKLSQPAFTEVKTCPTRKTTVGLATNQQIMCSALMACGATTFLLAWCIRDRTWGVCPLEEYPGPLLFDKLPRQHHVLCPELFVR